MTQGSNCRGNAKIFTVVLMCIILVLGWSVSGRAEFENVNVNKLIEETQMMSEDVDDMTLVWWMPNEFWQISFAQEPSISAEEVRQSLEMLANYTIIMLVDGSIGTFGGVTYQSESYLRSNTTISDMNGKQYAPMASTAIDADTKALLTSMKPVFANMLGPMGENMHFLVFPAHGSDGQKITNALEEGFFTVMTSGNSFTFRLPLGSLLPPKYCPVDGEEMNGAWNYCPWHGEKLILK